MSENDDILITSVGRLLTEHVTRAVQEAAEAGQFATVLWQALEEMGLTLPAVPEAFGGTGGSLSDELAVLRGIGRHAAPVPLAETVLAGWLLAGAGMTVPLGPLSVAPVHLDDHLTVTRDGDGWQLSGTARRVPWGEAVGGLAVLASGPERVMVAQVAAGGCKIEPGKNLAGEPRDTLTIDRLHLAADRVRPAAAGVDAQTLFARGALLRAAQMAGALDRCLDFSVRYAGERSQFGKPIGRFQAVQQQLAILAGQCAAAGRAVAAAYEALGRDGDSSLACAIAKARVGEAAGIGAAIAHQVHGAMGFTHEHTLHYGTRRLWSWRDEFGSEAQWQMLIGRRIAAAGADSFWPRLTGTTAA